MIAAVVSIFAALATGCALAGVRACRHAWFTAALGAGIGIGLVSLAWFVSLESGMPAPALEAALLLAAAGCWFWRRCDACPFCAEPRTPRSGLELLLAAAFALAVAAAVAGFLAEYDRNPHGGWDAWALYNLRARFLLRGGANWRDAFSPLLGFSHTDYPLLVPAFVARTWHYLGREATWVPAVCGFVFTFSAAALLACGTGILSGREAGWAAGLLLLSAPYFALHGAAQYADVPLAFFIVATVILLAMYERWPGTPRFAALAGLTAGLAAWSKNEGLLFLAVLAAVRIATRLFARQPGLLRRDLPFAAGLAPVLAIVFWFRSTLATANDLFPGTPGTSPTQHALDLGRHLTVAGGMAHHLWTFGDLLVSPFLFVALYLWLARPDPARDRVAAATALGVLVLMLAGYYGVYVVSTADLAFIIDTSAPRLLLQVWPLAILAAVFWARPARPS